MEIKQTKMAFMLTYLYYNELFFLSGTVLCYKYLNCLCLEKKNTIKEQS